MNETKKKLGLIFFPAFDWEIGKTHPERKERLLYTKDQIDEEGLSDLEQIKFYNPKVATERDISRVHFVIPSVKDIVTNSHLISSGAAIEALNLVKTKKTEKAFALVRPPGHHAMKVVHGDRGFCVINNEAIMIENLRSKYGNLKVAIIDTDAHHGDGTEDIYWNDPNTLVISIHQDPKTLYPGTGFINELGGPSAFGYNINIPLPPFTSDEGLIYIVDNLVLKILEEYKPDIVINSAGQDNHYSDPLTNMNFSARGYGLLNEKLNPDIVVLEGGYAIEGALPYTNLSIILAMAGLDYSHVIEPDFDVEKIKQSSKITLYIKELSKVIYENWSNKEIISEKYYGSKKYITERKQIYFDTSNIFETQTRTYKKCSKCTGVTYFESETQKNKLIKAITIPLEACLECQNEGYELYENSFKNKYNYVYLNDRVKDEYYQK